DHSLPAFDGVSAFKMAREKCPDLPFIFVSGALGEEKAVEMLKAGATDCILKDRIERLVPAVIRALREGEELAKRREAEKALSTSESRYRRLFEAAQDGILLLDPETATITDANPFVLKILGYTREEVLGKKLWNLGPFQDIAASEDAFRSLKEGGYIRYEDLPLETKSGEHKDVEFVSNVYWAGDEKVIQCNIRDITDRKQAENEIRRLNEGLERRVQLRTFELEAVNRELEAFTYSVAHDLRVPLRHIEGFTKILTADFSAEMKPGAQEYLQHITDGAQSMTRLIDDLLNLAHITQQNLKVQAAELNPLVEKVISELKPEMEGREIEWKIGALPSMDCDPGLMKQVFFNLLSNAIKYTRPRKPAVIQVGQMTGKDGLVIFVRDNGVGFNMASADRLFGAFQRLHRKEDFEGTGIGLATVRRIIHKHGGRIWADAETNEGAAFYFTLGFCPAQKTARPYHRATS
ncbi:MAG: ATP-binding protein, partial [Terriglobia bacterium]